MNTIDWKQAEGQLVNETTKAVREFAAEHPGVECCYFAFDSEPQYGYVLMCFDNTVNSRRAAQAGERFAVERRPQMLSGEQSWQHASYFLRHPVLAPFGGDTGDFA